MNVDVLIVGGGICGTMLSYYLLKEGKTVMVIDEEGGATPYAAGVINPVTGRRYVTTWMIEHLMPFAKTAYDEIGKALQSHFIFPKSIIDFFPTAQMRNAFIDRLQTDDTYLHSFPDQNHFNQYFNYAFGCGEIKPAYTVHLSLLVASWRQYLSAQHVVRAQKLDIAALQVDKEKIVYEDVTAQHIIFCEGAAGAANPWFDVLPFAPNKGEALVIECKDLTNEHIFKQGLSIVPLPVQHLFWVGSSYQWQYAHAHPTPEFKESVVKNLSGWLKPSFNVLFHYAALRPATLERRPFVGFHPVQKNVGILNGTGTKGASLAPYFASALAQHIVHGLPLPPEADVARFSRMLSK